MKMSDTMIRATAADNQILALAATTREMVEEARARHNTSPVATAALGRLLTAGAMMGSMLKGTEDLLTLQVQCDGPIGGMTVTANSTGDVKGYVRRPDVMLPPKRGKLDVGGAVGQGTLRVIKDMGMKEPYVGQTRLVSGEVAEDLTYYFATSEQVPSTVALGVLMEGDNTVRRAGGFLIQLMPFTEDKVVDGLEEKVRELESVTTLLDEGMDAEGLLERVLGDWGLNVTARTPTRFSCNCSRERVEKALFSIGRDEIDDIYKEGKPVELHCHFCNSTYRFEIREIEEIRRRYKEGEDK